MNITLGSIFWLKLEGDISHPHVVISLDNSEEVTVCGITTNMKKLNMPGVVVLEIGEGNLEKQSIVESYKTFKVKKSELKDYIGSLSQERVSEILNGIGFVNRSFLDK